MPIITFLDLIKQEKFRDFVCGWLEKVAIDRQYIFPVVLPKLYKYRSLTNYSVNDIINGQITATSIGNFNDLFDGSIHRYGTKKDRQKAAEEKWREMERLRIAANLPEGLIQHEYCVGLYEEHFKTDSRLKFRQLDYLGTYICCLSSKNDSTLMWAHYADSNSGICVGYDFNELPEGHLLKQMIFPVAYSNIPVDLVDLLDDEKRKIFQYPLDAAVLCAALNKSDIWSYENEWRIVYVLATMNNKTRRLPINTTVFPCTINFGYHFLKPLFYYDFKNQDERTMASEKVAALNKLIDYMENEHIPAAVMVPVIGEYKLTPVSVETSVLKKLLVKSFKNNEPENIRYYYTIHDELMDVIETHKL